MDKVILLCNPAEAYKDKKETEVARAYTKFAIEDYDKLVRFNPSYDATKPDLEQLVWSKGGLKIKETVFAEQPITKVSDVDCSLISTSYLFNPECKLENLLLPDLDIVELRSEDKVQEAASKIKEFYEKAGWRVETYRGEIRKIKFAPDVDKYNRERFPDGLILLDEIALTNLAEQLVSYNKSRLCFKED